MDYADRSGWTDLHWAAILNLPELAEWLLDKGMHADQKVTAPFSDELVAVFNPLVPYPELRSHWVDYLSEENRGAKNWSENRRSMLGYTALHLATRYNTAQVAELLIAHGANVNARTRTQFVWVPLGIAAQINAVQVVELLIAHGADVNARTDSGDTPPLYFAIHNNGVQVAELLIAHGADVNARTEHGWTPLHSASRNNAVQSAKLLIAHGADVNARTDSGNTPLDFAKLFDKAQVAELLRAHGAKDPDPVAEAQDR